MCSEWGRIHATAPSCCFRTAHFWHSTCRPLDISSLPNNSDLSVVPSETKLWWIILAAFKKPLLAWLSSVRKNSFHALSCHFRIELKTTAFIASHNSFQHVAVLVNKLETLTTFNLLLSPFSFYGVWHILFLPFSFQNLPRHFLTDSVMYK
jgi:hypothetical protein